MSKINDNINSNQINEEKKEKNFIKNNFETNNTINNDLSSSYFLENKTVNISPNLSFANYRDIKKISNNDFNREEVEEYFTIQKISTKKNIKDDERQKDNFSENYRRIIFSSARENRLNIEKIKQKNLVDETAMENINCQNMYDKEKEYILNEFEKKKIFEYDINKTNNEKGISFNYEKLENENNENDRNLILNQNNNSENQYVNLESSKSFDFSKNLNINFFKIKASSYFTLFNNYKNLLTLSLLYIVIFKLTFFLSLTLIFILLFFDFFIRMMLDLLIYFLKFSEKIFLRSILFEEETTDGIAFLNYDNIIIADNQSNENYKSENSEKLETQENLNNNFTVNKRDEIENENIYNKIKNEKNLLQNINKNEIYKIGVIDKNINNTIKKSFEEEKINYLKDNTNYKDNKEIFLRKKDAKKFSILKKLELNENAHSIISLLIISFYTIAFFILLTIIMILFYFDLKKIYFMLSENNDFVFDYFKNFITNNISDLYLQNLDTENYPIKQNKIFLGLKSLEAIFNSSFEVNLTEQVNSNFTIYGNI